MTLADRVRAFAEGLRDEGIAALVAYHDDEGWHLAAPATSWADMAKGLRTLADECERQGEPRTLN